MGEGGWHLPPQAGPAGGRADGGLEASEWPSGKGSVSLGWAEAEDTLQLPLPQLRQDQTELWRLSPAYWGDPGRASDLSSPRFQGAH